MVAGALDYGDFDEETPVSTAENPTSASVTAESEWTSPVVQDVPLGLGEKTVAELQTMRVEDVALPETISLDVARQKGHVNRLYEQETDLQTVIFQNQSGNMTAYVYDRPVKYIDANGNVRDKDTAITVSSQAGYAYAMTDNNVRVYFANDVTDGVTMQYGDASMTMSAEPSLMVSRASLGDEDNVVLYLNAFGGRTILRYQTLLNGIKEDIILVSNVGKNEFVFHLTTQGLLPVEENGEWKLVNENGKTVITFSEIKINDSAGKTVYGTLDILPAANGYTMTVTAPQEFLNASDTVYPVYIDPTAQAQETGWDSTTYDEYEAIIDEGLYATGEDAVAASDPTKHNLSSKSGKVIYKLTDFYRTNGRFVGRDNEYAIGRATMHITLSAGNAGAIHAMPMTSTWNPDIDNFPLVNSSLWNGATTTRFASTEIPAAAGTYGIDITDIVRGWVSYNAGNQGSMAVAPSNGFVIEATFSGTRTVNAVEANSLVDVWYEFDYSARGGVYYIISGYYGNRYLSKQGTTGLASTTGTPENSIWLIDYVGNDQYLISNVYAKGYFLNSTPSLSAVTADSTWTYPNSYYWRFVNDELGVRIQNCATNAVLFASTETVELKNPSTFTTLDRDYASWFLTMVESFVWLETFSVSCTNWLDMMDSEYIEIIPTPSNASFSGPSHFIWETSNSMVANVNSSGYVYAIGTGSCIITVTHKATGMVQKHYISVGQILENGTYGIGNARTDRFMSRSTESNILPATVIQKKFLGDSGAFWKVSYAGNGFYIISTPTQNKYLSLDGTRVVLSNLQGTTILSLYWRAYRTEEAHIIFANALSEWPYVIKLQFSSSSDGVALIQAPYVDDNNFVDEWNFYKINYTATVNNYYDTGYLVRHNLTEAAAQARIENFSIEAALRYLQLFGLAIRINPAQHYVSGLDTCKGTVTGENVADPCEHEGSVHSLRLTVHDEFKSQYPGSDTETNVLWSGHYIACTNPNGEVVGNRCFAWEHCVYMIDPLKTLIENKMVLIHELAHTYDGIDHYYEEDEVGQCVNPHCEVCEGIRPATCIMCTTKNPSLPTLFCVYCRDEIEMHLKDHH